MRPRILVLPISALVIAGLVLWRSGRQSQHQERRHIASDSRQLAPRIELYDQHSQLVKFERYLGRTALLILFFDGQSTPEENLLLTRLRDDYAALRRSGLDVVAVSAATPFAIRESERRTGREFPFPVLTDIDRHSPIPVPVHRIWGLADDETPAPRTGLFFIERDGSVTWKNGYPVPLEDPERFVDNLLRPLP